MESAVHGPQHLEVGESSGLTQTPSRQQRIDAPFAFLHSFRGYGALLVGWYDSPGLRRGLADCRRSAAEKGITQTGSLAGGLI